MLLSWPFYTKKVKAIDYFLLETINIRNLFYIRDVEQIKRVINGTYLRYKGYL